MRSLLLLALFSLLSFAVLQAQNLVNPKRAFSGGLVIGAVGSQVDGDHHSGYHRFAPMGGFWVSRLFTDTYGLRFEFRYIGKGSLKNEGTGAERRKIYGLALHYIELPVIFEYHFLERWVAGLGVSGGYLLSAKEENQYGNLLVGGRKRFRPYELAAHARIAFGLTTRCNVTLGASYSIIPVRGKMEGWDGRNGQFNNLLTFGLDYIF
jgi:hypothetical protein